MHWKQVKLIVDFHTSACLAQKAVGILLCWYWYRYTFCIIYRNLYLLYLFIVTVLHREYLTRAEANQWFPCTPFSSSVGNKRADSLSF